MEHDEVTLKKKVLEESIDRVLDTHRVPARIVLRLYQTLTKHMAEHKKDMREHRSIVDNHKKWSEETIAGNKTRDEEHNGLLSDYKGQVERFKELQKGDQGEPGYSPVKGQDYFDGKDADVEEIARMVLARIPLPKDGEDGKDATVNEKLFEEVARRVVTHIQEKKVLDVSHVKNLQTFVKNGVKYRVEELMHGGGSSSGTSVYNEAVSGSGTAWTLANTPTSGTLRLWGAGIRLTSGVGNDYTLSGAAITTANTYSAGTLIADYSHT